MKRLSCLWGSLLISSPFCTASPLVEVEQKGRLELPVSFHYLKVSESHHQSINTNKIFAYTTQIQIGSNQQTFEMFIDDHIKETWIPGKGCNPVICNNKEIFSEANSTTFHSGGNFTLEYGQQYKYIALDANGTVGYDSMKLAGIEVSKQPFGIASSITPKFIDMTFSGVLGFGLKNASNSKLASWLETAYNQGLIQKEQFSFYLSNRNPNNSGVLVIGDTNPDYYDGTIQWYPFKPTDESGQFDYSIEFDDVSIDSKSMDLSCGQAGSGCLARMDINSPFIIGPKQDVLKIMESINLGDYCNQHVQQPEIKFKINNEEYSVSPENYITRSENESCYLMFDTWDQDEWVLGSPFIRSVYTIFNQTDRQLGLAKLKK